MFKMLTMGSAVLSCLTVSFQTVAQESEQSDCALAEHYYSLAQDRLGASEEREAAVYLERAGAACPRYAYFQELGERGASMALMKRPSSSCVGSVIGSSLIAVPADSAPTSMSTTLP